MSNVSAFVLTQGEPSTADCIIALTDQRPVIRFKVVDAVPLSKAFLQIIKGCKTDYFVQVDSDMILDPGAVQYLKDAMDKQPDDVAIYGACLWGDLEERPLGHIKIMRHSIAKKVMFSDGPFCDKTHNEKLRKAGYKIVTQELPTSIAGCLGVHRSLQTPQSVYNRWFKLVKRHQSGPGMKWIIPCIRDLKEKVTTSGDPFNETPQRRLFLPALLGAVAALTHDDKLEHELTHTSIVRGYDALKELDLL